ncbi:MAG: hypothetical protein KGS72_11175 [Cyanobacteria bacterium REEB67]|nr:hypothetical protein [Cyanobacteria bacterium REEB67]
MILAFFPALRPLQARVDVKEKILSELDEKNAPTRDIMCADKLILPVRLSADGYSRENG